MGVTLSTHSTLAPISLASTIIGFVSFIITAATLLRVSWDNLQTVWAAPTEITDMLGNLKAGLYEERRHLRRVCREQRRRRSRSAPRRDREKGGARVSRDDGSTDRTLLLMRETIRHMVRSFRELERPFLRYEHEQKKAVRRSLREDDWDTEELKDDWEQDDSSYVRSEYRKCGLRERIIWLQTKYKVKNLMVALQMIQTRRIAKEVGDMNVSFVHMERDTRHLEDRLLALEQRLSRVVGVRRAE
ncbi:hypothetical protein NA57DRAFT_73938 [Rhizodiscina lignyota]|uniref:Uncharacterized protein n=1 Tax=Rhizodiscina lignyota TaxID=1504668 RepID=A0A9P4IIN1_9PEZI|nr:hypothetical protein NA57DRAFT_73938 [Rhizodiscina lignyota]